MLGYIHGGTVRAEFMASVIGLLAGNPLPEIGGVSDASFGPLVAMARNHLVSTFLPRKQLQWLWFTDTDICFDRSTLPRLLAAADPEQRPVVSALAYTVGEHGKHPVGYMTGRDKDCDLIYCPLTGWADDALVPVHGLGAGCLLIHRRVLEEMAADIGPHWFTQLTVGGTELGEDLSFSHRLAQRGIPMFMHSGVEVGHMKTVQLGTVR